MNACKMTQMAAQSILATFLFPSGVKIMASSNTEAPTFTIENIPQIPGPPSVARTAATTLASEVGSVLGAPADAFSRSITFFQSGSEEKDWNVVLQDPPTTSSRRGRNKKDAKLTIQSLEGKAALGRIQPGDTLKKINGKRIGPSYNAQRAMQYMDECMEKDGFLSIAVGNEEGSDVLVQATLIKPKPKLTAQDMGLLVWTWGILCIKEIEPDSLFSHTVLKATDHLESINDIECNEMSPESFNHIVHELEDEVTIVVIRGKQRWSGRFG
jgi:hypothetical protein